MVFGKKKVVEPVAPSYPPYVEPTTEVQRTNISVSGGQGVPKDFVMQCGQFFEQHYLGLTGREDFRKLTQMDVEALKADLLFAIFCELRRLKQE